MSSCSEVGAFKNAVLMSNTIASHLRSAPTRMRDLTCVLSTPEAYKSSDGRSVMRFPHATARVLYFPVPAFRVKTAFPGINSVRIPRSLALFISSSACSLVTSVIAFSRNSATSAIIEGTQAWRFFRTSWRPIVLV